MIKQNNNLSADQIITLYDLKELPLEGGFFCRSYYSSDEISEACLPTRYKEMRALGSAIYYLLTTDSFSAIHKLSTDEVFHLLDSSLKCNRDYLRIPQES